MSVNGLLLMPRKQGPKGRHSGRFHPLVTAQLAKELAENRGDEGEKKEDELRPWKS